METDALKELHGLDLVARRMSRVSAILQWDQETYLPPAAVEERADQLADIEGIAHERATDPRIGHLLEKLGSTTSFPFGDESLPRLERDFLRAMRRDYDRRTKLPHDFVVSKARAEGLSQAVWVTARKSNDFALFAPHLRAMVGYAKKRAEYWGFAERQYDGLIDEYEPGMNENRLAALFGPLSFGLTSLLGKITLRPQPDSAFLLRTYPIVAQESFCDSVMNALGYDRRRGRLDRSAHPFTTSLGSDDVRITTRYDSTNMFSGLFSVIHETGHALYELGFDSSIRGTHLADGASMGIHESQSRLWENVIGRSRAFWNGMFPSLKIAFPDSLRDVDTELFYRAVNVVKPSLIRVEADEVTYSLHVILRFNLERKLFSGELDVDDLPSAWRSGMRSLLGVENETDADGVLQDVHWSMGAFGYFPSYALGNLYGAQFWNALRLDVPDAAEHVEAGDFSVLSSWLHEKIHCLGRSVQPEDLVRSVCGESLSISPFLDYLEAKYSELYDF
ncbi:MAG: carboxypeptidase M32 [Treponemataceae bacterium]